MSWPSWSHCASVCQFRCAHRNLSSPSSLGQHCCCCSVVTQPLPSLRWCPSALQPWCACAAWEPGQGGKDKLLCKDCRQPEEQGLQQLLFHSWRKNLNEILQVPLNFTVFHLRKDCITAFSFSCLSLCLNQQWLSPPCLLGSNKINFHCLDSDLRPETLTNGHSAPRNSLLWFKLNH